jgi:hypothetical protein
MSRLCLELHGQTVLELANNMLGFVTIKLDDDPTLQRYG